MNRQEILKSLRLSPFFATMPRHERLSAVERLAARCQYLGIPADERPVLDHPKSFHSLPAPSVKGGKSMPYLIDSTERFKKAGKRLSAMSLEERYERILILAREFLAAKTRAHHQSFQEASHENAASLVMSWQDEKTANSVVECLEWIISGTIRGPQTIPEVAARENFSQQAAVF